MENPYYSCRLIVQGEDGIESDFAEYGAETVICGPDNMYVLQFSTQEKTRAAKEKIETKQQVEYCEPDGCAAVTEDDASALHMSWGVYSHSFLKERITSVGIDYVDGDYNSEDENSHGTHVAGTVVDCTPGLNVKILPVRVLNKQGCGYFSIISLGIRYAALRGADVINLSLGGRGNDVVDSAVRYAVNCGCTVVAAAGNDNNSTSFYSPAHLEECIVVSALDKNQGKADFSNYGDSVDVAAPGVEIVSCVPEFKLWGLISVDGQESKSGTSMVAPHISSIADGVGQKNT